MTIPPDEGQNDDEYWLPEPKGKFVKGAYIIDPYYYRLAEHLKRQISVPEIFQYKFVKGAYVQVLKPIEYGAYMEYGGC